MSLKVSKTLAGRSGQERGFHPFIFQSFCSTSRASPVILATQEAEIRRTTVQSQSGKTVLETLSGNTLHKNRAGGVTQGEGPEFKPQYCNNNNNKKLLLHPL
jgi:hypothetical protein